MKCNSVVLLSVKNVIVCWEAFKWPQSGAGGWLHLDRMVGWNEKQSKSDRAERNRWKHQEKKYRNTWCLGMFDLCDFGPDL